MISLHYFLGMVAVAESSKILAFFPVPAPSHHFIFRPVMEGLAKNGHDILYVTSYPYKEPPINIKQIDLSKYDLKEEMKDVDLMALTEMSIPTYTAFMYGFGVLFSHKYIGSKEVQDLIHSDRKFDAVMFESYFYQEYLSALIHKFNAIGIEVMSLGDCAWVNEMSGMPDNPAYQLDFKAAIPSDMNFWRKLYNVYVTGLTTLASYYYLHYVLQPVMDKYFNYTGWESRPPIEVLSRNRSLILTNFDYLFGYPYPVAPHRKDIGGVNIKPTQPLPKDLQTFMDESKDGVIFMSLGSHINSTAFKDQINAFLAVFEELPHRVLMKYDSDDTSHMPPNVKASKWYPQQDILGRFTVDLNKYTARPLKFTTRSNPSCYNDGTELLGESSRSDIIVPDQMYRKVYSHKKCVLFVTHGGLLSLSEAIYYGVPLVGVPILADQEKNLVIIESHGFGRMLKIKNITRDTVSWAVHEVLSNSRYTEEVIRRSKKLKDRRHSPVEEAVYWVEHSLKYPFALTPKAINLSTIELHLIDVKLFITSVLLLVLYILYSTFKCVKTIVCRTKSKTKQKLH